MSEKKDESITLPDGSTPMGNDDARGHVGNCTDGHVHGGCNPTSPNHSGKDTS